MHAGTESDDASLIEASRGGDRTAFAQIIERHHRAVYAVAYSGVRDHARSEDITQDTFVLAWSRLDDLRDSERLAAWLCGIARNLARAARRQMYRESLGDEAIEPVDATTPLESLTDAESERLIVAGLAEVPDVYREPMVLFYYQDRSVEDVARALGITPATTNKRLSRGRRFLAERVATLVEHGLRGPRPALAGAIVAAIALLPAAHVDASPLVNKGSTMSKIAIAAAVTAFVGAGGLVAATTMSGTSAHAQSKAAQAPAPADHCLSDLMHAAAANKPSPTTNIAALHGAVAPSLSTTPVVSAANDCTTVGRHLAELEADATYGPEKRPDEATCEKCASHYVTMCETQSWSVERRACSLAAADLLNAHLCAAAQAASTAPNALAPELQCAALGVHIADTVHAGGIYTEVTDMHQQVDSACQLGGWSVELRTCFAAATTVNALQACIDPNAH